MPDCIIKAGESIEPSDSRLSDTACLIEPGVIIRPPPDLTVAVEPVPQVVSPKISKPKANVKVVKEPIASKADIIEPSVLPVQTIPAVVNRAPAAVAHTAVPNVVKALPPEDQGVINPTTVMLAVGATVAVAGTAAAGSALGGISAVQAKLASFFGSAKGVVATATVVTAGTIVAVKALEKKMNTLEQDIEKTKKEVGDTASSIDRIDALLDKLGS